MHTDITVDAPLLPGFIADVPPDDPNLRPLGSRPITEEGRGAAE